MYRVEVSKKVLKQISTLPSKTQTIVYKTIESLENEPRPLGCIKLESSRNSYRIRVGNYRIVYSVEDSIKIVEIYEVGHRKDIYKGL